MDFGKTIKKAFLGFLTFITATLASNPGAITSVIPENIAGLTIGGIITAAIVGVTNWLKHRVS